MSKQNAKLDEHLIINNLAKWRSKSTQFRTLWNYSSGFFAVWIAHLGRHFGLFEQIFRLPSSAATLSTDLGLYRPAVEAWASAATACGYLQGRNGRLVLSNKMKEILLDASSQEYLGGQFSYLALRSLEYGEMDSLFKLGYRKSASLTFHAIDNATEWDHFSFIKSLECNLMTRGLLKRGCRFLDIGCGTGGLLKKLVHLYPNSIFEGIDPSKKAVDLARRRLSGTNVKVRLMSAEEMLYRDDFDILFLGEVLYSVVNKERALAACRNALRKNGLIAIIEGLLPAKNLMKNPENLLISLMQIDYALQGAGFMTDSKMIALLNKFHFQNVMLTNLGGRLFLITGRK